MAFLNPNAEYVDLAALSLSGSLVPSVPTKLMIKYDPPKLTIVYHFEQKTNQEFYHDIELDRDMLATKSADDVVSHLYVTEAYYFNPKQVKRSQLLRLIGMVQQNMNSRQNKQPQNQWGHNQPINGSIQGGQINIQDNAFGQDNQQVDKAREARRKNFFEKKRFINYPYNNPADDPDSSDNNVQLQNPPAGASNNEGQFHNGDRRGAGNANALTNQRKRFDELQIQNKVPSHSPQPDMPAIAAMPKTLSAVGGQSNHLQNLPPLKGQRQGPISDPIFLNKGSKGGHGLHQQPEHVDLHQNNGTEDYDPQHVQAVAHHLNPQYGNMQSQVNGQQDLANDVDFESGTEEGNQLQQDQPGEEEGYNQGSSSIQDGAYEQENEQNNNIMDHQFGEAVENDEEGAEGEEDEGESVYMIDGVVMRMIQIEGEDNQYLMDPQGRIYDMQANFIGTANTQGLEEMGADQKEDSEQQ